MPRRQEQFTQELRDVVGALLLRHIEFPLGTVVTVTRVTVGADARHATAYVSVLPETDSETVLATITQHRYEIQGALHRQILRGLAPKLSFRFEQPLMPLPPSSP